MVLAFGPSGVPLTGFKEYLIWHWIDKFLRVNLWMWMINVPKKTVERNLPPRKFAIKGNFPQGNLPTEICPQDIGIWPQEKIWPQEICSWEICPIGIRKFAPRKSAPIGNLPPGIFPKEICPHKLTCYLVSFSLYRALFDRECKWKVRSYRSYKFQNCLSTSWDFSNFVIEWIEWSIGTGQQRRLLKNRTMPPTLLKLTNYEIETKLSN